MKTVGLLEMSTGDEGGGGGGGPRQPIPMAFGRQELLKNTKRLDKL